MVKLYLETDDGKEKYVSIKYLSLLKVYALAWLGWIGIILGGALVLGIILQIFGW